MKKVVKWIAIITGGLAAIVLTIIILAAVFVDVKSFKPEIETGASDALNRKVNLDGKIKLSFFPWIGFSISDLSVENPAGFSEKRLLSLQEIEVGVSVLPLLSKEVQVNRFVLVDPKIVFQRNEAGKGNWEGLGPQKAPFPKDKEPDKEQPPTKNDVKIPIKNLAVEEFSITGGSLVWIDEVKKERKEISDLDLRMEDISFDRQIRMMLSLLADGHPLSFDGKIGPIGKEPGKGKVLMDLTFNALDSIETSVKGHVENAVGNPSIDLKVEVKPFSARKAFKTLGQEFPIKTADPETLTNIAFYSEIQGTLKALNVTKGTFHLDDSKLDFTLSAKDFAKPDIAFDLNLDQIDIDRYLPPKSAKKKEPRPEEEKPKKKPNYEPLRKLVLQGSTRAGRIKAGGAVLTNLRCDISGENGVFKTDPVSADLYSGILKSAGKVNVNGDVPETSMELEAKNIQIGPLLRDATGKDLLEGTSSSFATLSMKGDDDKKIRSTLNGKGNLVLTNGAIKGLDLTAMAQNAETAFGLLGDKKEGNRTDFSELTSDFTIRNGLAHVSKINMVTPLLRLSGKGKANCVTETLDFRLDPRFVDSLKGKGDKKDRKGFLVPINVDGTFSDPRFTPDVITVIEQLPEAEQYIKDKKKKLKNMLGKDGKDNGSLKKLFKSLPFD